MSPRDAAGCPVANGLGFLGDGWTLLIVREALNGPVHYDDLRSRLGISDNTLTRRLTQLRDDGLIERAGDGRRAPYRLTPAGADLARVMAVIADWSQRWYPIDVTVTPPPPLIDAAVELDLPELRRLRSERQRAGRRAPEDRTVSRRS